jgi:hypothetical protein
MLLVLVLGGWLGWRVHWAQKQREAVAAIKVYGGTVRYDWELEENQGSSGPSAPGPTWLERAIGAEYFQDVVEVNLSGPWDPGGLGLHPRWNGNVSDAIIPTLRSCPRLRSLHLHRTQATDRAMDVVGGLTELEELSMRNAAVTDAGIAKLKRLSRLKILYIGRAGLGDESLRHLASLPKLEYLLLPGNNFTDKGLYYLRDMTSLRVLAFDSNKGQITDAGLAHLKKLTKLEELVLIGTQVTDAGLDYLKGLRRLQHLDLSDTRVTPAGVKRLQSEMPTLKEVIR